MADSQYILEVNNLCQHFTSGRGKKKLTVKADKFSETAKKAIEAAGGTAEVL